MLSSMITSSTVVVVDGGVVVDLALLKSISGRCHCGGDSGSTTTDLIYVTVAPQQRACLIISMIFFGHHLRRRVHRKCRGVLYGEAASAAKSVAQRSIADGEGSWRAGR